MPSPPSISLPKGGGAIRGIGEKFAANPVTGTGTVSVPLATSPGRSGFGPSLSLQYDSGAGNGPFGYGWQLSLPAITRKTDKGLPRYADDPEDIFILSGAEDLVPVREERDGLWERHEEQRERDGREYVVQRYRPRTEGLFARIERWTDLASGEVHWRSITSDNVTTLYGRTAASRIADPHDPSRVFSWLICESFDDTGNGMVYEYKPEDSENVDLGCPHEANRTVTGRSANRYLKRIKYGNLISRLIEPDLSVAEWLFEVVFDYGEHDPDTPRPADSGSWLCRQDPFSSYRAGFEVRSYRLCQRVLMFHHFPDEEGVGRDCLTRSTDFVYRDDPHCGQPIASFLASVVQCGYRSREGGYLKKWLPPLAFSYTEAQIDEQLRTVDPDDVENLPTGLDGSAYQWVDLDGEGVSGILTEQANGWFYKDNLGGGHFGPLRQVATLPSTAALRGGRQQLVDLSGDGRLDLVDFGGTTPGFFERTADAGWDTFRAFRSLPTVDWGNPNLRLVDLTGDGHADVLITEDDVFSWYPSLAEDGFGHARRTYPPIEEEAGPRLVFADREQAIYLADMSGDGLTDLARIRNGEVCYWPNLGYGRFGAKVVMDNAPWFDEPDLFDQRRIQVADIDGSGTTDILYLHSAAVRIYRNRSGNGWEQPHLLPLSFPRLDNIATVSTVDLLGNGTACLVWSSPLPSETGRPLRYVDLMGGQKPHLLVQVRNNLGAETHVHYAPSTRFYLADKAAGKPWITRLPFPVHVVERVETVDRISHNRFVTRYAYHHGYFDPVERDFHGFGLVEQWDTETFAALSAGGSQAGNLDAVSHVPPVLTKTWFHTGAFLDRDRISRLFEQEYYRESEHCAAPDDELLLPDTVLPDYPLSPDELRQACRALKGSVLHQEIYAIDGSEAEPRPYTVSERNYTIKLLQPAVEPRLDGSHPADAVFFVHPRETITAHYERKLYSVGNELRADPRVSHELLLAVDNYGNELRSVSIAYGRRHTDLDPVLTPADHDLQRRLHMIYTKNSYTNAIEQADAYRKPSLCQTDVRETLGLTPDVRRLGSTNLFHIGELADKLDSVTQELSYEQWDVDPASLTTPARRLIEQVRTLYRSDELTGPLPLGVAESLALPFETYRLAFTPSLLNKVYGYRVDDAMLAEAGGYVHQDDNDNWWIPSDRVFYSPDVGDSPVAELTHAHEHFFLPHRFRDPFGAVTSVTYDRYDLLPQHLRDAVDNVVSSGERDVGGQLVVNGNDYSVLQPRLVMDANRNRVEIAFDALGIAVGTALMGKPEEDLGDTLDDFDADPDDDLIAEYLRDPFTDPNRLLQRATTRIVYDLFAYVHTEFDEEPQPMMVAALVRETHVSDLLDAAQTKVQHSFSYSDGFGREIQKKVQAEPGPLTEGEPDISPRWVGTGWTIFNNKGKPIRKYEPFFSATHRFEFATIVGVSPILFYDPVERAVVTLHPNETWEKTVFDPWSQADWDVNDTVLTDPYTDLDISTYVGLYLADQGTWRSWHTQRIAGDLGTAEKISAKKTEVHASTPARLWFDSLGQPFLNVAHNRFLQNGIFVDELHSTRTYQDVESNEREVIDPLGRCAMRYGYDMLSERVQQVSMDANEHLMLDDVSGKPICLWNSRGFRFRTEYDTLRRPMLIYVQGNDPCGEVLHERIEYGEDRPNDLRLNLRTQVFCKYDAAGIVTTDAYDFKGNLLDTRRQLALEYKRSLDWSTAVPLEERPYPGHTRYDALNRLTEMSTPDNTVLRLYYNEANLLERLEGNIRGTQDATTFVASIGYNARGQRVAIEYGNGAKTGYTYDPNTFLLTCLRTHRGDTALQDLSYTYDPSGNITQITDRAQQEVFFRNNRVEPSSDYTYDATYRLIEASGREHLGQAGNSPVPPNQDDTPRVRLTHPNDGKALGRYVQRYAYDAVGNILKMIHRGDNPAQPGWTRIYHYAEPSLLEPDKVSNRLTGTTASKKETVLSFTHDAHGNITAMPELPLMRWDFADQLQASARQMVKKDGTPETTYYVYNSDGERVRKVTESQAIANELSVRKAERIYFGTFEIYREYTGNDMVSMEREALHVTDDRQNIAIVETCIREQNESPEQLLRFQFANHLGSSALELDDAANIISYEEYYPYGGTSYQAIRHKGETLKRYRFIGKERDEESGLNYHGTRYYAPWLGRWMSTDLAGLIEGTNLYRYSQDRPLNLVDDDGRQGRPGHSHPAGRQKGTGPPGIDMFSKGIGNFSKDELNAATTTVFGEISATASGNRAAEARAVASTIFNRKEWIDSYRERRGALRAKQREAINKQKKAEVRYEELARNPSKYQKEYGKSGYATKLDAAKVEYKRTELERRQADRDVADFNKEKDPQSMLLTRTTKATLGNIVAPHREYEGTRTGKKYLAMFSQQSAPAQQSLRDRWLAAKEAVRKVAAGGKKAEFDQFRSIKIATAAQKKKGVQIGGNIFWRTRP